MSPICRVEFQGEKAIELDAIALAKRLIEDGSKKFSDDATTGFRGTSLPDLTFVIKDSDDAELIVSDHDCIPYNISEPVTQYSARFRIPPTTLKGLPEEECKKRAQRFAVGSLMYEIMAGKPPFEDLEEGSVQQNFEKGLYPTETMEYPLEIAVQILGFWSQEFTEQYIKHSAYLSPQY